MVTNPTEMYLNWKYGILMMFGLNINKKNLKMSEKAEILGKVNITLSGMYKEGLEISSSNLQWILRKSTDVEIMESPWILITLRQKSVLFTSVFPTRKAWYLTGCRHYFSDVSDQLLSLLNLLCRHLPLLSFSHRQY